MTVLIKRDFVVRQATENDLPRLHELEELCWQHSRASKQQIRARLKKFPHGQFVVENDGNVLGVIYSQRIASTDALVQSNAGNVHQLHEEAGSIVQLLDMHVDSRMQDADVESEFLASVLEQCRALPGVEQIVGVVTCKNFDAAGALAFDDYLQQQGNAQDAALAFHASHGARVIQSIPKYRPKDVSNQGYGVLVSYDMVPPSAQTDNYLFVLSAANQERLQAYAAKVAKWLAGPPAGLNFGDAIYTWQVARTVMKQRLAIKARDSADLQDKLKQWLGNQEAALDVWSGAADLRDQSVVRPWQGEDGQQRLAQALADKDWNQLGEFWTAGADIDWPALYAASAVKPRRTRVPTYTFAQERHWVERAEAEPEVAAESEPDAPMEQVFVTPVWEPAPVSAQSGSESADPIGRHEVILFGMAGVDDKQLASLMPSSECSRLPQTEQADIGARFNGYALACFEKIKTLFAEKPQGRVLFQVVVPNEPEPALFAGLSGMFKTAADENANFAGQIILTDAQSPAALAAQLNAEKDRLDNAVVQYTQGLRHVLRWQPVRAEGAGDARREASFREGGVYLITGGLGGLGVMFAKEILRCAPSARVILTGRSALSRSGSSSSPNCRVKLFRRAAIRSNTVNWMWRTGIRRPSSSPAS